MVKWVAIKCRISSDDEKRGENVEEQEAWGRDYAAGHFPGMPVKVYVDNDISAADRRTERPGFDGFCTDIAAGNVAHVVCTNRNRITRDLIQWIDMADELLIPFGIEEIHTKHRGVQRVDDIATDIDAVLGRREIRVTRRLVLDKHAALFKAGRPSGGRSLGYDYAKNDDKQSILVLVREKRGDAIYAGAKAVLRGWSLSSLAEEWTSIGVPQVRGGTQGWVTKTVHNALTSPTVAGWRTNRRHPGQKVRGTWRPILATMVYECSEGCEKRVDYTDDIPVTCEAHGLPMAENKQRLDDSLWRSVCAELGTRQTATGLDGRPHLVHRNKRKARRYLLTGGLARCGLCGAALKAQQMQFKRKTGEIIVPYYSCPTRKRGGCGKIGIRADKFEKQVEEDEFLAKLNRPEFRAMIAAGDPHQQRRDEIAEQLGGIETKRRNYGRQLADDEMDEVTYQSARRRLKEQEEGLRAELAGLPIVPGPVDLDDLLADWDEATLDEKRHFISMFVEHVEVLPSRGGPKYDPDRVKVRWRRRR